MKERWISNIAYSSFPERRQLVMHESDVEWDLGRELHGAITEIG